jgi:RecA/RadA recombinase
MERPAKKKEEKQDEEKSEINNSPEKLMEKQLKDNKAYHYNFLDEVKIPRISSGSLIFDSYLGGGFTSGLQRMVGFTEGGKTSESLEVLKNFLATVKKGRGLLIKAEGRLSDEMMARSGLKFVWKTEEWLQNTVFVLETNNYNLSINIIRDLVINNTEGNLYGIIFDSMDALCLQADLDKQIDESSKVAGAPSLTKKFLQRFSIAMNKFGHLCIMIGQVSAKVEIDPYAPKDNRQISATGGNGAMHFSNFIIQFEARNQGDLILEDPAAKPDAVKNKILGHWAKVIIKKSPNEKSNIVVKYPIKYGRTNGTSIWREYEIADMLLAWQFVTKKGSWLTFDGAKIKEIKEKVKVDLPETIQGLDNLRKYLEDNKEVTDYFFNEFKKII